MIEFFVYYYFAGLVVGQLIALYTQYAVKRSIGHMPHVNYGEVVISAFTWPLLLWNVINTMFKRED